MSHKQMLTYVRVLGREGKGERSGDKGSKCGEPKSMGFNDTVLPLSDTVESHDFE